jgi:limonene-1,2-epoxide hydrolase
MTRKDPHLMSRAGEAVVRQFLELLHEPDTKAAVELLHDDVEWRNSGAPTLRGKKRVGGMLRDMEKRHIGFEAKMHHVAATGDVVLTDRTDVLSVGRWETSFWVRGTFEVVDGTIRVWDDAFSWADLTRSSLMGAVRAVLPR